jgi:hypothetical protein
MEKQEIENIFPINSYLIHTTIYGETSGCQIHSIKYRKIYNNTYTAYIKCWSKNDRFFFNEYSIHECRPDIDMNRKMKLKRIIQIY